MMQFCAAVFQNSTRLRLQKTKDSFPSVIVTVIMNFNNRKLKTFRAVGFHGKRMLETSHADDEGNRPGDADLSDTLMCS